MNETTKYGLFFVGGVIVGALGAVALTRGKLDVMAGVEGVKEDLADVVAEAEVKAQEKKLQKEAQEAAAATETPAAPAAEEMKPAAA